MKQFLEEAKKNPGKLTLGSATPAGAQMIMATGIKGQTNTDFRIIPYQGGKDLKKALLGNQVNAGIIHAPVLLAEAKAGIINVIGTGKSLEKINYKLQSKHVGSQRIRKHFAESCKLSVT